MKKNSIVPFTILAGSILALVISFSDFFKPCPDYSRPHVSTIQTESRSLPETSTVTALPSLATPSLALPSTFIIQPNFPSCLLFELFSQGPDKGEDYTEEASLHPNVFFEITFRLIISPNAP